MSDDESLIKNVRELMDNVRAKTAGLMDRPRPFNVLPLLINESDEVNLHSKLIADLLDPSGSHRQGDALLNEWMKSSGIERFDTVGVKVTRETDCIDILVTNVRRQAVIIENKIYAGDQDRQLPRYIEAMKNRGYRVEDVRVVYLTLDGREPESKDELTSMGIEPLCLAYRIQIREWLKSCLGIAALNPPLRETLAMYLDIILRLTHQSGDKEVNNIVLQEILSRPDTVKAAFAIAEGFTQTKIELQSRFWQWMAESLAEKFQSNGLSWNADSVKQSDIERYYTPNARNRYWYGIQTPVGYWEENTDLYFRCEIGDRIYFGIVPYPTDESEGKNGEGVYKANHERFRSVVEMAKSIDHEIRVSDHWIAWRYTTPDFNWQTFDLSPDSLIMKFLNKETGKDLTDQLAEQMTSFVVEFRKGLAALQR